MGILRPDHSITQRGAKARAEARYHKRVPRWIRTLDTEEAVHYERVLDHMVDDLVSQIPAPAAAPVIAPHPEPPEVDAKQIRERFALRRKHPLWNGDGPTATRQPSRS